MNYSKFRFTLDMHKHQSQVSIPVMQGDTAVELYITFTDGGKPYTIGESCWAVLVGNKPDGSTFRHCAVVCGGTHIHYIFQPDTSDVAGTTLCDVRLYGTNGILTAPCFTIVVDERITHNDVELPTATISAIDRVFLNEIERVEAEHQREEAEKQRAKLDEGRYEYLASLLYPALDGVLALQDGLINMQTVYSLNHDKESYTCIGGLNIEALTVADAVNDKPVTIIAPHAFKGYDKLERIALSSNIKTIGKDAFADCASLTDIYVPWSKWQVAGAPWGATDTTTINYNYLADEGLVYALSHDGTYYSCIGFEGLQARVIIPQTFNELPVKEIGASAFAGKTHVTSISIPNGVETIAERAFERTRLGYISIPNSVTNLGANAFQNCSALSQVTIGKGVTTLKNNVFAACINLREITIPANVEEVQSNAFYNCTSLRTVVFEDTPFSGIASNAFNGCRCGIYVPWGRGDVAYDDVKWGAASATIRYYDGLEFTLSNGTYTVTGYNGLKNSISIPNTYEGISVTHIGKEAFQDSSAFTSIFIPENVKNIASHAFRRSSLEEVIFANDSNLTILNSCAFQDTNLTEIVLPKTLQNTGENVFYGCSKLTKVTFTGKAKSLNANTFRECSADIYVPWAEGEVANAPWGTDNTKIHYNSKV